ncbi:hypothetical protein ACQCVO_21700 [Bacillus infantis]|uniref:hypothetical protein n=1 Tax=Bacillus infantis TaxID=324767 RepID=UPI003CEEC3D9
MQLNGRPSWSVVTEGAEDLNFAIYVACTYDLFPNNMPFSSSKQWSSTTPTTLSANEKSILKSQWKKWWNHVVLTRSQNGGGVDSYPQDYLKSSGSELGQVCYDLWPPFFNWWHMPAGGNTAMIFWESADNVNKYVKEFEQDVGRTANPFRLKIDLVYTGLDDVLEVSDVYAIIPIGSPHINKSWWTKKIKSLG